MHHMGAWKCGSPWTSERGKAMLMSGVRPQTVCPTFAGTQYRLNVSNKSMWLTYASFPAQSTGWRPSRSCFQDWRRLVQ